MIFFDCVKGSGILKMKRESCFHRKLLLCLQLFVFVYLGYVANTRLYFCQCSVFFLIILKMKLDVYLKRDCFLLTNSGCQQKDRFQLFSVSYSKKIRYSCFLT